MRLTTTTQVSVDGVVQGNGGRDENRSGGFERGGWARPLFDSEAMTFVDQTYQRADAFLFGRRSYMKDVSGRGTWPGWAVAGARCARSAARRHGDRPAGRCSRRGSRRSSMRTYDTTGQDA